MSIHRFIKSILFSGLLLPTVSFADTAPSAQSMLAKMAEAQQTLNYEISFVKTTPINIDSLRYRHFVLSGKNYAQLVSLEGAQQEMVQRDNLISYFHANFQPFTIQGSAIVDSLPAVMRANFEHLSQYYDFLYIDRNRVADRIVQNIRIVPKDDFRYQYIVSIDEETQLLLQSNLLDRENNLLEQFKVVNLSLNNAVQPLMQRLENLNSPPLLTDKKAETSLQLHWAPTWLPQGFKLINQNIDAFEGDINDKVESQLYSDGLFSFTLYMANPIVNLPMDNIWRQGAFTVYSETINGKEITFVGSLPLSTAKRIVRDLSFN